MSSLAGVTDALYPLLRPLIFKLDAEVAHHLGMASLRFAERSGLLRLAFPEDEFVTPIEVMGLKFPNRIGLAAGLDKEGNTIDALGRLGFGFVEIGTITPRRLTTPLMKEGALAMRVGSSKDRIS